MSVLFFFGKSGSGHGFPIPWPCKGSGSAPGHPPASLHPKGRSRNRPDSRSVVPQHGVWKGGVPPKILIFDRLNDEKPEDLNIFI